MRNQEVPIKRPRSAGLSEWFASADTCTDRSPHQGINRARTLSARVGERRAHESFANSESFIGSTPIEPDRGASARKRPRGQEEETLYG